MEWLRINEDDELEFVSEEVKLQSKLAVLTSLAYNKGNPKDADGRKRLRGLTELKYMYLAYSYKSPYRDYTEAERIHEAKLDCGYSETWKESKELQEVIEVYRKGTPNKIMRLLKTTEQFIDKFDEHLRTINLNERNGAGGLVHDPIKVMNTLSKLPQLAQTLFELENQAKLGAIVTVSSRGDHEQGWMAIQKPRDKKGREDEDDDGDDEV